MTDKHPSAQDIRRLHVHERTISNNQAIDLYETGETTGHKLMAANLWLEVAHATTDHHEASQLLYQKVVPNYRKVQELCSGDLLNENADLWRASIGLAQLPLQEMLLRESLPENEDASRLYSDTIEQHHQIINNLPSDYRTGGSILTIAAAYSIQALLEKYAINNEISDIWWPIASSYSSQNAEPSRKFDTTILTSDNTKVESTYLLNIGLRPQKLAVDMKKNGITPIAVRTDLRIADGQDVDPITLLEQSYAIEQLDVATETRSKLRTDLTDRTKKLINLFEPE